MLRSGMINKINQLKAEGKTAYAIGKALHISKNTAAKYMREGKRPHGSKGKKRGSILDPFKPRIDVLMSQGVFNCVVIFEQIKALGYTGHLSTIKYYVHDRRPAKAAPAVQRYETAYGKQAQMDWGTCTFMDESGAEHHVFAFTLILGASRMRYVEFTRRCDIKSLERCILNGFEYFGGVPEYILTDNMKTVVDGRECGKVIWNDKFLDFATDIGFVPKVCKVRRPQTKGKIERSVGYVKANFIPGRTFSTIEDLNAQALSWCNSVNDKVHGTTWKIPSKELANEKLKALPPQAICNRYRWENRLVQRDGFVSFDGILYGVPWQYSGRYVQVRKCDTDVEIYYDDVRVVRHQIPNSMKGSVRLAGQYQGLAEKRGIAFPVQRAYCSPSAVETRDLAVYERLAEGGDHARS